LCAAWGARVARTGDRASKTDYVVAIVESVFWEETDGTREAIVEELLAGTETTRAVKSSFGDIYDALPDEEE
jgi:hypothetical protein